jgi:hypothetical protein
MQGAGAKEVTDQTAAGGSIFSYHEYNSPGGHFNGVIKYWGAAQPGYMAFNLRPSAKDEADAYVTFVGSNQRYITYVYCNSGGQLCVNAGNPGEDCSIEYNPEQWYFIELKDVDFASQTFDYYVDRVLTAEDVPFMSPTDDIAGVMLYNYQGGGEGWWDEIMVSTEHIVTWLTAEPSTGIVPPHSSMNIDVTFDATKLFTGQHQRSIVINNNDPENPEFVIPASIDVTAVPNIALSDTLLDFDKVVVGNSHMIPFKVINRSLQENLVVSDVVVDHPDFSVNVTTATLPPNVRQLVEVVYAPSGHGMVAGTLTIYSNDRDEPIRTLPLTGKGVDAPVLYVEPDSLGVELPAGSAVVESVFVRNDIANPEAANLEFVFGVDDENPLDWLSIAPVQGSVRPGSTAVILATFETSQLIDGDYPAAIKGSVNIPNTSWGTIVTTMLHVNGFPSIAVADSAEFGLSYVGFPVTRILPVKNVGTAELVVSNAAADRGEISVTPSAFSLAPGDSTAFEISLTPVVVGPISATMRVTSNDTSSVETQVVITADVSEAPSASLSVDSLAVSVRQAASREAIVTLENTGAIPLEWSADLSFERDPAGQLPVTADPGLSGAIGSVSTPLMDVLWQGTHGPLGSALWSTAIADIIASGGTVTQTMSPIDQVLLHPYDILWLGDTDGLLTDDECETIADWVTSGGSLLIEARNPTAVAAYQSISETMGSPIELRSAATPNGSTDVIWAHETTHGVSAIFLPNPSAIVYDATSPTGFLIQGRTGFTLGAHFTYGKGRVLVVTDWLFSDLAINVADNRRFMRQVFGWLSGSNWLTVEPLGGIVLPGQSEDLRVRFDSGELPTGDYELQIDIMTNDPANQLVGIPLTMNVEPLVRADVDLVMDAGLNLRSWNVELEDDSTTDILAPILGAVESVQGFDGEGLTFDPSIPPQFNTLKTMDHFHGYWIRLTESATLSLSGYKVDHRTPMAMAAGYNLIGYLPNTADSTAHAIESVIDHVEVVMGYDGGGLTFDPSIPPQFNTLQVMRPSYGYWIKLSEAATLIYPESPTAPLPAGSIASAPSTADKAPGNEEQTGSATAQIVPTHQWISVWGDDVRIGGERIPAGAVVSAIDRDGVVCGRCVVRSPGQFGLMTIYRDDPSTDLDEGAGPAEAVTVVINEHIFDGVEWTGMGAVINFNEVARMTSAPDRIPRQNALYQNFPNPFNPVTTITYDLAGTEDVKLAVFNIRGQRVRELVNEAQPAGQHRAEWDGKDRNGQRVASGVYFYRLEAGSYTRTFKMVLLK